MDTPTRIAEVDATSRSADTEMLMDKLGGRLDAGCVAPSRPRQRHGFRCAGVPLMPEGPVRHDVPNSGTWREEAGD